MPGLFLNMRKVCFLIYLICHNSVKDKFFDQPLSGIALNFDRLIGWNKLAGLRCLFSAVCHLPCGPDVQNPRRGKSYIYQM